MRHLALFFLLASAALAAPKSTRLVGAIYLPDGTNPATAIEEEDPDPE